MAGSAEDYLASRFAPAGGTGSTAEAPAKPYFGGSTRDNGIAGTTGLRSERGIGPNGSSMGPSGIGVGGAGYSEDDISAILRGMPPEKLGEMQRKMQRGGLLPENYKSFGFVDSSMRTGFAEVLGMANLGDSTYDSVLEKLGDVSAGSGRDAARLLKRQFEGENRELGRRQLEASFGTQLQTYERSDPAGVRQTAEAAFQKALGRKPRPKEMERFVNGFLGREQGAQAGVFAAQDRLAGADRSRSLASFDAETGLRAQQGDAEDALGELDTGTQPAPAQGNSRVQAAGFVFILYL